MGRRASLGKRREWAERMDRFQASRQTVAAFCETESISMASFYQWRRKLRDDSPSAHAGSGQRFKPVELAASVPAAPAVTVRLAGGIIIEVGSDSQALPQVLEQILSQHAAWQRGESPC